jgi:hypothetical protein
LGLFGLHNGIGPSSALSIGVAIATYVQAKPTIRINILTARFMVFSLRCETPGRKPRRLRHYTEARGSVHCFLRRGGWATANSLSETLESTSPQRVEAQRHSFLSTLLPDIGGRSRLFFKY